MTGHAPDYTMLMVGANAGIVGMTKEVLVLNLIIPFIENLFKALGISAGTECSGVCCGHQNRYVSSKCSAKHIKIIAKSSEISRLSKDSGYGSE